MMIGSLGIAAAQNKLSVGYGAEAGHMDPLVAKMCGRYCSCLLYTSSNPAARRFEKMVEESPVFDPLFETYGAALGAVSYTHLP